MPIATHEQYCQMLEGALAGGYAFPAINITSTSTANAALAAFAELKSDGIIQVSTGGGKFASGQAVGDMALGAISLAQHIHLVAEKLNVAIALHTDHCHPENVESFMIPLIEESEKRIKQGLGPLFNSHMFDGSPLPLEENLRISKELLERCNRSQIILEVETGIVGGEEDGVDNESAPAEKLYTTPEDMVQVAEELRPLGKFMYAATFGNVHGVYKPGNVKLKPEILRQGQDAVVKKLGKEARHWLVFHGGSGSELSEIHETLEYGVVKMNVDTDTQYAYSRAVAQHMFENYDKVLKVDGEVGSKKHYDPRAWSKAAEKSMTQRVMQSIIDLKAKGKSILASVLIAACLLLTPAEHSFAAAVSKSTIHPKIKAAGLMAGYGTVGGALLGVASLAFGSGGRSVARGASIGLYAGLLFGTYVILSHAYGNPAMGEVEEGGYYPDTSRSPYEHRGGGWIEGATDSQPPRRSPDNTLLYFPLINGSF